MAEPDRDDADGDDDELAGGEQHHDVVVGAAEAGGRVDAVLAGAMAWSRAQAQRLIEDGRVTVSGVAAIKSARVREGDVIAVTVPAPEPLELAAEPIPLAILFEDADLIVIDKPAGLVVHPAAGHHSGTLVNALLHHCQDLAGIGGVRRPGIVHRLDKDTTGVIVATKTERAHAALTAAFAAKSRGEAGAQIERTYLGIASPPPSAPSGVLRTEYGRHPIHRKKFSSKVVAGKPAVTHWEVVDGLHESALVRFRLETGRTHQIRVHAADHGWPLVGDPVYGQRPRDERVAEVARALGRQALHAATLAFEHPVTGVAMAWQAPLPQDLQRALAALAR